MAEIRVKETGTIKLFESDNTSSVTIASPASLGADRTITLPDGDVTLVAGTMSTGGVTLSGSTNNTVTTVTGADALAGEANLTFDGSTLAATGNITATGDVVVGAANDTGGTLSISSGDSGVAADTTADELVIENNSHCGLSILSSTTTTGRIAFGKSGNNLQHQILASHAGAGGELTIYAAGSATPYIMCENNGNKVTFGMSGFSETTAGGQISPSQNYHIVDSSNVLVLNRETNDGYIQQFRQDNTMEGNVSISGTTTSYNSFCGAHWGRLADNSQPTILRGTVMESIDTMIDWYRVKYTVPEKRNDEGVIITERDESAYDEIALPDGKSVGDIIKHTAKSGIEYDAEIELQDNEQLPMTKISDTEDSNAVYGVFSAWDNEPNDSINDMNVASLGAFIIRVHKDETVAIGDLLSSKGDGTAKVQADDIMRASTIAKVTSTNKTYTYDDGSYCVPCTLHCG